MSLRNFFLPHPKTHKKAHLISWYGILSYLLIFILLNLTLNLVSVFKPGVLGISSEVNKERIIELTNQERAKNNLSSLSENEQLNNAAMAKAQNMFEENYWAHYSPSGKDPWQFIMAAGYKFMYAGENLARNFYKSEDVVVAWMESRTHRENILNPKYQDIGIAVIEGTLDGQQTVLVVQEFGAQFNAVANLPNKENTQTVEPATNIGGEKIVVEKDEVSSLPTISLPESLVQPSSNLAEPLFDPYTIIRTVGVLILLLIGALLVLDLYVLHQRSVLRISSRHLPHFAILGLGIGALLSMSPGSIL